MPDFPKKGILFWDVTTLMLNPQAFKDTIDLLARQYKHHKIDIVAGVCGRQGQPAPSLLAAQPILLTPALNV